MKDAKQLQAFRDRSLDVKGPILMWGLCIFFTPRLLFS